MTSMQHEENLLALMRARDWSRTSLGHPSTWDLGLRTTIRHTVNSRLPMFLVWGQELTCVSNECCAIFLGEKYPHAVGAPIQDVWGRISNDICALVDQALAGESPCAEDLPLTVHRQGRQERAWFTFSCSPVFDEENHICGVLCTAIETTARVLAERRRIFQLKLSDRMRDLTCPLEVTTTATRLIGEHFQVGRVSYAGVDVLARTVSFKRDWTNEPLPSLAGESCALAGFGPNIVDDLQTGKLLRLDDIAGDNRSAPYSAHYASIHTRALLAVPLLDSGTLTAALFLHEEMPRCWTEEDVTLFNDAAQRTWEALKRARVEEKLRDESRILALLQETGLAVSSTLDMRTLLQTITDRATALSGAKFGAFFYVSENAEGESLMLYTLSGAPLEAFEKFGRPRATPLFGPLFHGAAPIRSDDITKDPRYGKMGPHHGMPDGHLPVRSYLAVPIILRSGESAGGLLFGHPEPGIFDERTEHMLTTVAAQAATALDNARLYEVAQRAAEERQTLLARERTARAEAEKHSNAKDEFLAMLAHELRNPLAPIKSAAELLERVQLDAERVKASSKIIVRQVNHMTGLINDLLDVSRVTRGLVAVSKDVVDIKRVIADAVEQVRPAIDKRGHCLNIQLTPHNVQVQGEHKRLVQVLVNILGNAAKYTPNGGRIDIKMEEVGDDILIHVADDGVGLTPELRPYIFEPFTQAERTPDRSQGGLGLGLALVKNLVQLHGGTVTAQSEGPDMGSTFSVRLQRLATASMRAKHTEHSIPIASPAAPRTLRVLVVEDNADAAATLRLFLESLGHMVTELHSSEAALRCAQTQPFDACLLDIGLPDMDGNKLARELRLLPTTRDALLIAVTGYSQKSDRDNTLKAGFDHYLVKPASAAELISLLARHRHCSDAGGHIWHSRPGSCMGD
jgi:signal transduction histidine kinase/ActR/RegA family two-component response regulator